MAGASVFSRVLCPTDFSDISTTAVSYGAALAAAYGSRLRLLHVVAPFPVVAPVAQLPIESRVWETAEEAGRSELAAEAARVRRPGIEVETELRRGSPVHQILAEAEDWRADLIVLGTHGRGGFERLVLGSATEKVMRKATCAVVAVPPQAASALTDGVARIDHVLCALDGSRPSAAGVAVAVALAERTGAKLTLATVVEALPEGTEFSGPAYDQYREARDAHARDALDRAVSADVRVRCNVHERLVYGHPAAQILEVAAQERPDLLVMGVQGRGAIDLAMFGSTTNHVVRQAHCPVLTMRLPTAAA